MLHIKPLKDEEADKEVGVIFDQIKSEFSLDSTPLFFQYLGRFPKFLDYFWKSVQNVIHDPDFNAMVLDCQKNSISLFSESYSPSSTATELVSNLFENDASREYVKKKIETLLVTNIIMALVFVAAREAVKGWALSTNLLRDKFDSVNFENVTGHVEREVESSLVAGGVNLDRNDGRAQFDYVRFMAIVQSEMDDSVKQNAHLYSRLEVEEFLVASRDKIFLNLSYPILAEYAYEYKYFDELVYLMSESFPTVSANRVIASTIGVILLEPQNELGLSTFS